MEEIYKITQTRTIEGLVFKTEIVNDELFKTIPLDEQELINSIIDQSKEGQ